MNTEKKRVLGRVLAVEETKNVSGSQTIDIGTDPLDDVTDTIGDSNTCSDTAYCNSSNTDVAPPPTPTNVLLDCPTGTRREMCLSPADP
jgi:hypothetical protein